MTKHHDASVKQVETPSEDIKRLRDKEYDALSDSEKSERRLRDPNYPYTPGQPSGSARVNDGRQNEEGANHRREREGALINDGKPGKVLPPERDVTSARPDVVPASPTFPAPRPGIKPAQRDKP